MADQPDDEGNENLCCGACSADLPSPYGNGLYGDGDELACGDCGARNFVSCDGEEEPYISWWRCKHGVTDDTMCEDCESDAGHHGNVTP